MALPIPEDGPQSHLEALEAAFNQPDSRVVVTVEVGDVPNKVQTELTASSAVFAEEV